MNPPTSAVRPLTAVPRAGLGRHVEAAGNHERLCLAAHGVPLRVHRVDLAGRRVVVDERQDAEVADRRAGRDGNLRQRGGERGVHRVAAALERFEPGARRDAVVGDGDRAVRARRDAGGGAIDVLRGEILRVVARPTLGGEAHIRRLGGDGVQQDGRESQAGGQQALQHAPMVARLLVARLTAPHPAATMG
jgi:hypothetical protein